MALCARLLIYGENGMQAWAMGFIVSKWRLLCEVLRRSEGSVELLDVSSELPELIRHPGLKTWKVRDKGLWLSFYEDVPMYRRNSIIQSMFPSEKNCKDSDIIDDGVQENVVAIGSEIGEENVGTDHDFSIVERENNSDKMENNAFVSDINEAAYEMKEVSNKSVSIENLVGDSRINASIFPLERCLRIVPHDQNSGAFFIAVLQKLSHMQAVTDNHTNRSTNSLRKVLGNKNVNIEKEQISEIKPSEDVSRHHYHIATEAVSGANIINEQSLAKATEAGIESYTEDICSKDNEMEEVEECNDGENGHVGTEGVKGKDQMQGSWRGVDPVVFFRDEMTINSIKSFYGISESFPLDGHLVTRNTDANHVKRIYYISKSVHDILRLNIQVGQRLKITSLGLKMFERQTSKDGSSPVAFRLSSEGLPLLLPYVSRQLLYASLIDFQHLLKYRVIKFSEFVDADFGEKASELMPGCCLVALLEGNSTADTVKADALTIAIVCWKGKTNLSIMVSQLDAQELLSRLSVRFGDERSALPTEGRNGCIESDGTKGPKDAEADNGENDEAADLEEAE